MNLNKDNESMFNMGVPNIIFKIDGAYIFSINTVKSFEETDRIVKIEFAEDLPEIKRGLLCDVKLNWINRNAKGNINREYSEEINDLLLVHIDTFASTCDITTRL